MNIIRSCSYRRITLLPILLFFSGNGVAADVNWVEVTRDGGRVDVRSEFVIDAPLADVRAALLSYDQFDRVGDTFAESRYVEPAADGAPRIYTRTEGCIAFFCKTIERYARLETAPRKILAIAEPELSDADYSVESWELTAAGDTTVITYRHELEAGFWLPPLLGDMLIKRSVKLGTRKALARVESIALLRPTVRLASNGPASPPADAL